MLANSALASASTSFLPVVFGVVRFAVGNVQRAAGLTALGVRIDAGFPSNHTSGPVTLSVVTIVLPAL